MKLRKIHIKGLKTISDLSLAFEDEKPVSLLYGTNGVGKTTILEAISLIGHLSCMRRICVQRYGTAVGLPSFFHSWFLDNTQLHSQIVHTDLQPFEGFAQKLTEHYSEKDWFNNVDLRGTRESAIYFESVTELIGINDPLNFYIVFERNEKESMTQLLGQQASDFDMQNHFAIVFDEAIAGHMEILLTAVFKCRPHATTDSENLELVKYTRARQHDGNSTALVSYINTDLNDFGRGNDIRESPKDIRRDFVPKILDRLQLPFHKKLDEIDTGRVFFQFNYLKELNSILELVINTYDRAGGRKHSLADKPLFSIRQCCYEQSSNGDVGSLIFEAQRSTDPDSTELDYMSAGENECFFIFLLLIGLPLSHSIILLDEPDLHLTTFAKDTFYDELYKLLDAKNCQVFIASHSGFAYADSKKIKRFFIQKKPDGTFESKWSRKFELFQSINYVKAAIKVGWFTWKIPFVVFLVTADWLAEKYKEGPLRGTVLIAIFSVLLGAAITQPLSFGSDIAGLSDLMSDAFHTTTNFTAVIAVFVGATIILALLFVSRVIFRAKKK
jgi:hypothetical protein